MRACLKIRLNHQNQEVKPPMCCGGGSERRTAWSVYVQRRVQRQTRLLGELVGDECGLGVTLPYQRILIYVLCLHLFILFVNYFSV